MQAKVAKVIEVIRPAIQADKGDIKLHSVDEDTGVVIVELLGACVDCPASTQTLKDGVQRILMDRIEGVTEVRQLNAKPASELRDDGKVSPFANDGTAVTL